jgi:flagellar biogenesis protein FliO
MAQNIMRSMVLGLVVGGWVFVPGRAHAQAPNAAQSVPQPAAPTSFDDDVPPPTAYDRLLAEAPLGVQPETRGLMHLAGRLLAALVGVVALIYASLKFLLPRYFTKWSQQSGRELKVVERLSLDGHNAVVLVETNQGQRLLLGTGEHGVQFLTRLDASKSASFEDTLIAGAARGERATEERHAAEH